MVMVVAIQGIPYCWKPREKQSARWSRTATQHLHRKIGIKGDGGAREAVEISESSWSHIRPSIMLACHGPLRLLYQINHSKYLPTRDRRKIRMRLVIAFSTQSTLFRVRLCDRWKWKEDFLEELWEGIRNFIFPCYELVSGL